MELVTLVQDLKLGRDHHQLLVGRCNVNIVNVGAIGFGVIKLVCALIAWIACEQSDNAIAEPVDAVAASCSIRQRKGNVSIGGKIVLKDGNFRQGKQPDSSDLVESSASSLRRRNCCVRFLRIARSLLEQASYPADGR